MIREVKLHAQDLACYGNQVNKAKSKQMLSEVTS